MISSPQLRDSQEFTAEIRSHLLFDFFQLSRNPVLLLGWLSRMRTAYFYQGADYGNGETTRGQPPQF
jgi:hypothetical protein